MRPSGLSGLGLLAAGLLLALHAALVLDQASRQSTTYDEPYYASSGWARIAGGKEGFNPEHPPAVKLLLGATWLGAGLPAPASIPGFAASDQWAFGPHALYDHPSLAPRLLLRARGAVLLLSLALAIGVLLAARRAFGDAAGLLALALYALDPLVVANAGLATLDLPTTAAIFGAVALAWRALDSGRAPSLAGAAVLAGLAVAAKGTGLVVLPALLLVAVAPLARPSGAGAGELRARLVRAGAILLGAAVVVTLVSLPEGGPSAVWRALQLQRAHAARGHSVFALGQYGLQCPTWYFPVAWAIKTPIPLLLASAAGLLVVAGRLRRDPTAAAMVLATPALLVAAALASGICNGVRQLLPATPFLAVAGGAALGALAWSIKGRVVAGLAVAWLALGLWLVHPDAIAYANEAAGGPGNTWRLLADANVDWGQALPSLAGRLRGVPVRRLWLEYFGTAWPPAHGVERYRRVSDRRFLAGAFIADPRRDGEDPAGLELLAVSATSLTDVYVVDRDLHAWLRERTPWAWAGHAIAVYDITGDAAAHRQLARMAERMGDPRSAAEARARAEEIEAGAPAGPSRSALE